MDYKIFNQTSILEKDLSYYFHNFFNGIGVNVDKKYIKQIKDNTITFSDDFKKEDVDFLIKNYFINTSFDKKIYQEHYQAQLKKEQNSLHLILLPAGCACNFNCVYCYENHNDKTRFSSLHSDQIYMVLQENKNKQIHIEYFGGEPLLNYNWIINFQEKIQNIKHSASMTTNGYLLTEDKFKNLIDKNIKTFQITIDGTKETHDKLRPLTNKQGTYETILNNLKEISKLQDNFNIILRCNFNKSNSGNEPREQFFKNISFLKNDFRFSLIFRAIGLYSSVNNRVTKENLAAYYDDKENIKHTWEMQALESGFLLGDISLYTQIGGMICYASKASNYTINPDMKILKCTIALEQDYNYFGNLNNGLRLNKEKIKNWKENIEFSETCEKCFFFFQCMGKACVLKNFISQRKICPIKPEDEKLIIEKIIKQKELLKRKLT